MPLGLRRRLKLPHLRVPGRSTIQRTLAEVNVDSLVRVWQAWVEEALSGWCPHDARAGLAIDGKVVRGSAALEVLGAMVHGLGVMLANHPIPESTNEAGALQPFLESLLLEDRVVTLDAAHTSQATAQAVVQKWHTTQKRHGRLVRYRVRATAALNDYLRKEFGWRFVGQCLCIERECLRSATGERTSRTHYAITDLSPQRANVRTLFALWHRHWHIENKGHWI